MPELTPEARAREKIDEVPTAARCAVQDRSGIDLSAAPRRRCRIPVHIIIDVV
jgi:hypothetical protein